MSKDQLINLITVRPAFNIEESIANIIKERERELKYFIYYNYGYLSLILRMKFLKLKKYEISKFHKQDKPKSPLESIKRSKPIESSEPIKRLEPMK